MSDGQFGALMAMLSTIGVAFVGALRWAVKWGVERLTKALDDNTASNREAATAQLTHAAAMATLTAKIDTVTDWVHEHTPVGAHRAYETPRGYEQVDAPPSLDSERRRQTRERAPPGYSAAPIPEPLPETTPSAPYHFSTRKR